MSHLLCFLSPTTLAFQARAREVVQYRESLKNMERNEEEYERQKRFRDEYNK